METNFIRERVSIRGVIRPLEPEAELPAFKLEPKSIGTISELSLRRYIQGKAEYEAKFCCTRKHVAKERERHLKLARKEGDQSLAHLESYLHTVEEEPESGQSDLDGPGIDGWTWSWALDDDEHPPPSSIVSRRDTWEARRLAMMVDDMPGNGFNGNDLWKDVVSFLTVTLGKKVKLPSEREHPKPRVGGQRGSDWVEVPAPFEIGNKAEDAARDAPVQANSTALSPTRFGSGSAGTQLRGRHRN